MLNLANILFVTLIKQNLCPKGPWNEIQADHDVNLWKSIGFFPRLRNIYANIYPFIQKYCIKNSILRPQNYDRLENCYFRGGIFPLSLMIW